MLTLGDLRKLDLPDNTPVMVPTDLACVYRHADWVDAATMKEYRSEKQVAVAQWMELMFFADSQGSKRVIKIQ